MMKKPTGTAENMCDQTIAMEIFEQQQAQETKQKIEQVKHNQDKKKPLKL
jgi:hypothetical protein